jgi:ATPase family associated with various cellular activities (AAA)
VENRIDWRHNDAALQKSLAWLEARIRTSASAMSEVHSGQALPNSDSLGAAIGQSGASERPEFPPTIRVLADRFGLTQFEQEILLLTAASEFHHGMASLFASINADAKANYPTFGLAMSVFDAPSWDALSPDRPLRYWRLIEVDQTEFEEITRRRLRISERILHFIKGLECYEELLSPYFVPVVDSVADLDLSEAQASFAVTIAEQLLPTDERESAPVVALRGRSARAKLAVARQAAHHAGLALFHVTSQGLPTQASDIDTLARLWDRECALIPVVLFVSAGGTGAGSDILSAAMIQFVDRCRCPLLIDGDVSATESIRPRVVLEIASATRLEQRSCWAQSLPSLEPQMLDRLADAFDLEPSVIGEVARRARVGTERNGELTEEILWAACLRVLRPQMDALAERVAVKAGFDDIVLPPADIDLLRQIAGQVRSRAQVYEAWGFGARMNRGLGISALFCGESGTGKTMAAEVIANELRFDLYRIDLATIVSKYIGETEKNLRRLFDAAEGGGVILFFDEADALFGKRSEVKDSHDRYANIEVNYLLQKMESYRGLSILATNRKSGLDSAFLRRIRFVIDFPFPGPAQARALWTKVFPSSTPKRGLDLDRLARMKLTGGSIHNIALHAAFLAAHRHKEVDTDLVLQAARVELRKLGRPVEEANLN